ncbi:protein of unknown function [Cupriavidus taiwanensis]|nr:protein of unknown function [Cupriavidus taiwanensis]SOZ43781.1 protein of unknown function [Cupriavidus taiwanensis]
MSWYSSWQAGQGLAPRRPRHGRQRQCAPGQRTPEADGASLRNGAGHDFKSNSRPAGMRIDLARGW